MKKYADIINKTRPLSSAHPPMPQEQRAKIFAPFSALRGYEEAAASYEDFLFFPSEPAEEKQKELDEKLRLLRSCLLAGSQPTVKVTVFHCKYRSKGCYSETEGPLTRIDTHLQLLTVGERKIPFAAVHELESPVFAQTIQQYL